MNCFESLILIYLGIYFSSYLWENVFCELCKDNFTENVTTQFGVVNILGIEIPKNDSYIILEAMNSDEILKKNTKIGNFYILIYLNAQLRLELLWFKFKID